MDVILLLIQWCFLVQKALHIPHRITYSFNPRKHFTFFAAESDILGVENHKRSEVLFIQFLCFMKSKLKINGFF
jgi:hypothetical protein